MELYGAPFTLAGKCQLMTSRDRGAWVTSPQILPMPHHHLRGIKQLLNLTLSLTRCVLNNVLIQICLNYIANHPVKLFFFLTEDISMKCYRHYTSPVLLRYCFMHFAIQMSRVKERIYLRLTADFLVWNVCWVYPGLLCVYSVFSRVHRNRQPLKINMNTHTHVQISQSQEYIFFHLLH